MVFFSLHGFNTNIELQGRLTVDNIYFSISKEQRTRLLKIKYHNERLSE